MNRSKWLNPLLGIWKELRNTLMHVFPIPIPLKGFVRQVVVDHICTVVRNKCHFEIFSGTKQRAKQFLSLSEQFSRHWWWRYYSGFGVGGLRIQLFHDIAHHPLRSTVLISVFFFVFFFLFQLQGLEFNTNNFGHFPKKKKKKTILVIICTV